LQRIKKYIMKKVICTTMAVAMFMFSFLISTAAIDVARVEALKEVAIEHGIIVSVEHQDSPVIKLPDGKERDRIPPRTIVKLELSPAPHSLIRVEIWLPDSANWNGNFLGLGNGGAAGRIGPVACLGGLIQGYATATTDMGTSLGGKKKPAESGIDNPDVWRDFGFRATHLMSVTGKLFAEKFYGRPPALAFFNGSSTGGQQALSLAQRYPADYDGILAGIPAHCRTPLHAYFVWNEQILSKCPFTKEQQKMVVAAALEHFGARETTPGAAGKIVTDPRWTPADIEAVVALAMKTDSTLTTVHGDALRNLFGGPHTGTGERIFNGIPPGAMLDDAHGGGLYYLFRWVFGAGFDPLKFDFDKDMDVYTATLAPLLNAENDDLTAFKKRGGKLLMFSGSADAIVPWHATAEYYDRVSARFGVDQTRDFFAYYLLPGWQHGRSPVISRITPDFFRTLVNWREKGEAPGVFHCLQIVDGKTELDASVEPYAPTGSHEGLERISDRFRLPAQE
jgi:feruloyl esterase